MISIYYFFHFIKVFIKGIKEDSDFKIISIFLVILLSGATFFYMRIENWSMVDALYFSVMTMSTVGYGDLSPSTDTSKIFTIFYAVISIGTFVSFTARLVKIGIEKHKIDTEKRRERKAIKKAKKKEA